MRWVMCLSPNPISAQRDPSAAVPLPVPLSQMAEAAPGLTQSADRPGPAPAFEDAQLMDGFGGSPAKGLTSLRPRHVIGRMADKLHLRR